LQHPYVKLAGVHPADSGHQPLEPTDIIMEASLVLVLQDKLRRCLLEGSSGPNPEHPSLSSLFQYSREMPFSFFEPSRSRTLANSPPEEVLVDMPDTGSNAVAAHR
jgi:hypothetical protein